MDGSIYLIYLKALALAFIEGVTEFIPVSSTGHMILIGDIIQFTGEKAHAFEIFIQLGAILAVLLIYKEKFFGLIPKTSPEKGLIKGIFIGDSNPTVLHISFAILPILILGFLFHSKIKELLFSPLTVAIGLIVGGILMIIAERIPVKTKAEEVEEINFKQAFLIGVGQCFALWPGMSRSGSTMIAGLLLGIKHKPAADFSFIIAVPVMFIAVCYDLLKSYHFLELKDFSYFILGFIFAFIIAWFSVKWFLKILNKVKLTPFGIYRIIIGAITLYVI